MFALEHKDTLVGQDNFRNDLVGMEWLEAEFISVTRKTHFLGFFMRYFIRLHHLVS